jgi:hypothetical protein
MHDYANNWFAGVGGAAAPRTSGRHAYAYLYGAPAAEPTEPRQTPVHDGASPDVEAASLVRRYVLVYEHSTGQAQTTRHMGTLYGVKPKRGAAR